MKIIDADRHVVEPHTLWRDYLPPAFKRWAPRLGAPQPLSPEGIARLGGRSTHLPPELMFAGQPVRTPTSERAQVEILSQAEALRHNWLSAQNPTKQLAAMDLTEVDVAMLFPTYADYLVTNEAADPVISAAFAEAYNNWLHDYCATDPVRLRGVALISRRAPELMVEQLARIRSWGWTTVSLRPNPVRLPGSDRLVGLADPVYEPFWSACSAWGIGVAFHASAHARVTTAGADRFQTRFAQHACSHPMEQMMAFLALLEGGVLERHPALRVGLLEAGASWLPYWLHRLDDNEFRYMQGEVREHVRIKPSEYFRRQCWIGLEPGEPCLAEVIRTVGIDRLLLGSDYPHPDHDHLSLADALADCEGVPDDAATRIGWDNPREFFGLDEPIGVS